MGGRACVWRWEGRGERRVSGEGTGQPVTVRCGAGWVGL